MLVFLSWYENRCFTEVGPYKCQMTNRKQNPVPQTATGQECKTSCFLQKQHFSPHFTHSCKKMVPLLINLQQQHYQCSETSQSMLLCEFQFHSRCQDLSLSWRRPKTHTDLQMNYHPGSSVYTVNDWHSVLICQPACTLLTKSLFYYSWQNSSQDTTLPCHPHCQLSNQHSSFPFKTAGFCPYGRSYEVLLGKVHFVPEGGFDQHFFSFLSLAHVLNILVLEMLQE